MSLRRLLPQLSTKWEHAVHSDGHLLILQLLDWRNIMQQQIFRRTRKPPLGPTITPILLFISAVIELLGGTSSVLGSPPVGTISDVLLGWFPLAMVVIELVLAWGLWTLKPWAY